ncbi:MAG: polymer-forming cytoskeletal protein [Chloroflexota bacterium]
MDRWRALIVLMLAVCLFAAGAPLVAPVAAQKPEDGVVRSSFTLGPGEVFSTDLVVLAGEAHLQAGSLVDGDVAVLGGTARLEGVVRGDVTVFAGVMTLGATAVIEGDLISFGQLVRDPGARIYGRVVEGAKSEAGLARLARALDGLRRRMSAQVEPVPWEELGGAVAGLFQAAMALVALLVLAVVVMSLLPRHVAHIAQAMTASAPLCLGVGLLTAVLAALLVPLLAITLIGIPVALALVLALSLCVLVGWVAAGRAVAQMALRALRVAGFSPLAEVFLGTLTISLAAMVPCLGTLVAMVLVCWSLGAAVLTRLGTTQDVRWSVWRGAPGTGSPGAADGTPPPRPGDTKRLDPTTLAPADGEGV